MFTRCKSKTIELNRSTSTPKANKSEQVMSPAFLSKLVTCYKEMNI